MLTSRLCRSLLSRSQSTLTAQLPDKLIDEKLDKACTDEEWMNAKPYSEIPGPKPIPILGNTWRFIFGNLKGLDLEQLHDYMYKSHFPIGKLSRVAAQKDIVFIYNPKEFEKVYRNEGIYPVRQGLETFTYYRKHFESPYKIVNTGLTTEEGEEWHELRTKVNQPMLQPKTIKHYIQPIAEISEEFIERMRKIRKDNLEMPEDFFNEINKWAMESITHIAIDKRLGCLKDLESNSDAQRMIENVKIFFDTLYILELRMSPWRLISTPTWRKFTSCLEQISEIAFRHIHAAHEKIDKEGLNKKKDLSLLERFFQQESGEKIAFAMTLDLLTAGLDTTSSTLALLLNCLATNPDKQELLFQEIKRIWPDPNMPITEQSMNNLKYLRACIKESMRLSPIIVGNVRKTIKDMVLEGYQIPKGTSVLMSHRLTSLMEEHFPKPNEFLPERWLATKDGVPKAKEANPFAYMPFGFGPRSCIGRRFANLEIEILTISIIRAFRVEFNHPPIKLRWNIIAMPDSPLKFKCIDRQY